MWFQSARHSTGDVEPTTTYKHINFLPLWRLIGSLEKLEWMLHLELFNHQLQRHGESLGHFAVVVRLENTNSEPKWERGVTGVQNARRDTLLTIL